MNKKGLLAGVGIVVVAAALIGPRFAGSQVEDTLKLHVEALNDLPAYKASVVSFDRGWFGSTAIVELGVDFSGAFPKAEQSDELSFEVVVDVQHGPVLTQFSTGLGLAAWEAYTKDDSLREFIEWEDEKAFYNVVGSVGLFGHLSYSDSISSFSTNVDGQQLAVSFSGYEGSGEASSDAFSYQGQLDTVEIFMENHAISFSEMKLSTEAQSDMLSVMRGELYEGNMSIGVGEVIVRQPDDVDLVNLQDLGVEFISTFSENNESMDIDMNYSVKALKGDDIALDKLTLNTAFNNIDTEFLYAYNQTMREVYGKEPEAIEEATKKLVKKSLPQLLQAEPEFVMSQFSGVMEQGDFNGNMSAKLVGVSQVPQSIDNTEFWLSNLIVDASIAIDKPLLRWLAEQQLLSTMRMQYPGANDAEIVQMAEQQVPMMINMYVQQGLLKETEDEYRSEFQMEDGEALLNGQKIPLGNMM